MIKLMELSLGFISGPGLGVVGVGSWESLEDILQDTSGPSNAVWPAANRALFVPFEVWSPMIAKKIAVLNGATVAANVDLGIYNLSGTRLVSTGSQTRTGASVIQVYDITDTLLSPGVYYMALASNSGTDTFLRFGLAALRLQVAGVQQMASAFPLPASAVFANPASAYLPWIGFSNRDVF